MKRLVLLFAVCLAAIVSMGQSDSLKKVNVYVYTPTLLRGTSRDTVTFAAMKETVKKRVNKCSKTRVCEDPSQCEYFLSTLLVDYDQKYMPDTEMGGLDPIYLVTFKMQHLLFYFPFEGRTDTARISMDHLIENTEVVEKEGRASSGYHAAIANACERHPHSLYINGLFEKALYVPGRIVELGKNAKGKDVVYVDKGSMDGISENQWFDVYLEGSKKEKGNIIGTLELVKREEHRCQCKIRKNKEQVIAYLNKGKTLVVESRESSNILKKIKKGYDDVRPYITTITKGLEKIEKTMSDGLDEMKSYRR